MRYQQEGNILINGLQTLVYAKSNPIQGEAIDEEIIDDDVGIIKIFFS